MTEEPSSSLADAQGWVRHLRAGGTTTWADWVTRVQPGSAGEVTGPEPTETAAVASGGPGGDELPGAAQAEVVRRLAVRWAETGRHLTDFGWLADLVLARSGPGRGLGDLPVAGAGSGSRVFGPLAMDPGAVPEQELLRICVGVLADLLCAQGTSAPPASPEPRRRMPWQPSFRLVGAPVDVAALRASLAARGLVEGGRRPKVLVVAADLDSVMRQVWTFRMHRGATTRWHRQWARSVARDRLPPRADLPRMASRWAAREGADRVHLVVSSDQAEQHRLVASVLGLRRLPCDVDGSVVPGYSPQAVDLLRRLNAVLGVRLGRQRSQQLRDHALPGLLGSGGGALQAPRQYRRWSRQQALTVRERLAAGGYAVHGNLGDLVPGHDPGGPGSPGRGCVLDTALRACLRAAENRVRDVG